MGNKFREIFESKNMYPFIKESLENSIKEKWCTSCIYGEESFYLQPGGVQVSYTKCNLDLERDKLDLCCEKYKLNLDDITHYIEFCDNNGFKPNKEILKYKENK